MESPERVAALRRFGYTQREAEFLELAVTYSGHFLRRQFNDFLGQPDSGAAERFLRGADERGHLRSRRIAKRTMLHHVASYQLYRAVAEPDCRHRRERALWAVRKKVMALDYVLAHRGERFLSTSAQKLTYISGELGLSPSSFPSKAYRGAGSDQLTRRYFVHRFPIHVADDNGSRLPVVSFCYIDDGLSPSLAGSGSSSPLRENTGGLVPNAFFAGSPHRSRSAEPKFSRTWSRSASTTFECGTPSNGRTTEASRRRISMDSVTCGTNSKSPRSMLTTRFGRAVAAPQRRASGEHARRR